MEEAGAGAEIIKVLHFYEIKGGNWTTLGNLEAA